MTRVLIVEDEPLVARMYEKALAFDNFEVELAMGGENGVAKTRDWKPDIVLMDIMMPGMNGIEALEKIKTDPEIQNIPIVMLTNLSGENDMDLAKEKGAIDYWVKKDIKPKEMGKKINKILQPSSL
ncbi:MAG TPA: response regulator [Patescibacteria group bacterium]|nr:response regulator [Patescibacteria group bacterium]